MRTRLLISASLVAASIFSLPSVHAAFTDVSASTQYSSSIEYLQERGILTGYPDGSFGPYNPINRAEFTKLIGARNINMAFVANCDTSKLPFLDINRNAWYAPYLCATYFFEPIQIINGYPDGSFRPEWDINFVEAAKILALSSSRTEEIEAQYGHMNKNWYDKYVYWLEDQKAIPTSVSGFDHTMTRGEMAEMLYRLTTGDTTRSSLRYAELHSGGQKVQWSTYTNARYAFTFQYPENWRANENPDMAYIAGGWYTEKPGASVLLCLPPDGCQDAPIRVSAVENTDVDTILSLTAKGNTLGTALISDTTFAGVAAKVYTNVSEYGTWKVIVFKKGNIVYSIAGSTSSEGAVFESLLNSFRLTSDAPLMFSLSSANEQQRINLEDTGGCGEVDTGKRYYSGFYEAQINGKSVPLNRTAQGQQFEMRFGEGSSWDKAIHTYTIKDVDGTHSIILGVVTQYDTCNNNEIHLVAYSPASEYLDTVSFTYSDGLRRRAQDYGVEDGNFFTIVYDNSSGEYIKSTWEFYDWSMVRIRLQARANDSSVWRDLPLE